MDVLRNGHPADHLPLSDQEDDEDTGNPMDNENALRQDLLARLQSPHLAAQLKAQMRATLALHLTPSHILTAQPADRPPDPLRELSHAVVAQHLRASACDFSLSVFLPESGLNSHVHPMPRGDLLRFLRVKGPVSGEEGSFLSWLMQKLPVNVDEGVGWNGERKQGGVGREVQTEVDEERELALEERLRMVEVRRRLGWEQTGRWDVAAAFERYEANLASNLRAAIRHELTQTHNADMKQRLDEEKSRHTRELLSVTANWEARMRDHTAAYDAMHQRLHLAEQAQFAQRQELLQQQEVLQQREEKARHAEEDGRRRLAGQEEELVTKAKQLAELSQRLENKNAAVGQFVEQKVVEALKSRGKELDEREERLKKEEATLMKLKEHLTRTIISDDDLPPSAPPLTEPKPFIQKIKAEFSRLHRENQKLKAAATAHSDYDALKTRLHDADTEAAHLRRQLAALQAEMTQERQEHTATVRELTEKMLQPERGMEALRREADGLREKNLLDGVRWEGERARLRGLIREKTREVEDWRNRWSDQKERYEQLNGRMARMQGVASQATWMMMQPPAQSVAHTPVISMPPPPTRVSAEPPAHDHAAPDEPSSVSLRSISEAKKRIRALEQEANQMQEHFLQYRRYVTDTWSNTTNGPTVRSPRLETTPAARTSGLILNPAALAHSSTYSYLDARSNGSVQRTASVQYERINYPRNEASAYRIPVAVENGGARKSLHLELKEAAEESRQRRNIEADVAELLDDERPTPATEGSGW